MVSGLAAELYEEPWRAPRDYAVIDAQGQIVQRFTVTTWSIEDELGASVYAVVDGALRNLSVSVFHSTPSRVSRREKTVVEGLQDIAAGDDQTLGVLSQALARNEQSLAEEQSRRDLAADGRIADIPGATDDYGMGDDFRRAQEVLRSRVRAYGERIGGAMLGALVEFGILQRSFRAGAEADGHFTAALDAFVVACRLAAFDRSLEKRNVDAPLKGSAGAFAALPSQRQSELRGLERTLDALEQGLLQEADGQEWSDARNNAIQFRAAAAHVALASENLKGGFESATGVVPGDNVAPEREPAGWRIPVGKRHRALRELAVSVHDYDSLTVETVVLPAGGIFQPWEPDEHWRGKRVPITLGDRHTEFGWGVSSWKGHFLHWEDFFSGCELAEGGTENLTS